MGTNQAEYNKKKMHLQFHSDDSFSPGPSPGGSLRETRRPRPSLGLPLNGPIGLSPVSRRGKDSSNLNQPLSREGLRFENFPKPSQDEYERKLDEIMKLSGVLNIDDKKYPTPIADLEPIGDLGNGTCGHVVKMRHKDTGKIIACKQMRRTGNSEETKRIVMDMDVVLKSHDCKEIVVCLGCFITASDVWICMELMATCFDKLLKQIKAPVPENICGKVAVATLNALNYLKVNHGVIHRDVKPSNILLDYEGNVKLCDFGISGRLVDSKARTRSAGCAAYMAPERINPPNPKNPDYDIRADVWSLGITLVELATGQFPYRDCNTEFEVLTKIIHDDPPCLPPHFSPEFRRFVSDCLLKNHKQRPKYKKLLEHPFIVKYRDIKVDVGAWYSRVSNHSGDPNKLNTSLKPVRKTSLETRNEPPVFKPQPSPRLPKSRRLQNPLQNHSIDDPTKTGSSTDDSGQISNLSSSFSRLNFYTKDNVKPELELQKQTSRDDKMSRIGDTSISPRYDNPRLKELSYDHTSPRYNTSAETSSSRLNGSLSRSNYPSAFHMSHNSPSNYLATSSSPQYQGGASVGPSSYHTTSPTTYRSPTNSSTSANRSMGSTSAYHYPSTNSYHSSRPTYFSSRSQDSEYSSLIRSKRHDMIGSSTPYSAQTSDLPSPRDGATAGSSSGLRKYSFERADSGKDSSHHFTPQTGRKYYESDAGPLRKLESPRKGESPRDPSRSSDRMRRESGGIVGSNSRGELSPRGDAATSGLSPRKPGLPVPDSSNSSARGREPSRSSFMPSSWKLWTLSSPISFRKFRTSSSTERAATFERRQHPTYRSLNERDKHYYSSSGTSDNF